MNATGAFRNGNNYNDLIATLWYVNTERYLKRLDFTNVLIDTWWNVNIAIVVIKYLSEYVLIDTWWNVNDLKGCQNRK